MASFASSATTGGARKHAWTNYNEYKNDNNNKNKYEVLLRCGHIS